MVKVALLDKLWAQMSERGDFPMLSQSLRTAVAAMKNDDLDFTALVQVVLSDFALTQKVLRLANSAMYMAFGGNITTVTRALMVLGMDAVGHLVVGLKLVDHFHQSAPHRIDAKVELNRTLLSGSVARKLTAQTDLRAGEEAVVCTLMRQVGKLLVVCYLEEEWEQIRRKAGQGALDETQACVAVLGVSFEEIGLEAASRWRLPETIRIGMGTYEPDADAQQSAQWLRAVTNFSTEVADVLTAPDAPAQAIEAKLASVAQRYCAALTTDPETLVAMSVALAREEAGEGVVREIAELRANADAIARASISPEARIAAGLEDLRALPSENALAPVLSLASETVLAGLGFAHTVVFVRQASGLFKARLGLGRDIERVLPTLWFKEAFEPDVFHLAIANSVGIFIENARDPKMVARLPTWFRDAFSDARSFVLLPVVAHQSTVALIYGDWCHGGEARKISQAQMSALNELARELGRFFAHAPAREVETL
ncbi:HDOD domain-containing protein [Trinickia caryophylli]|uniref:HDOD domain-containing protein n=1 Tax=Trinickia caryophylli TaxID=28094 RepID=A0A1X7DYH2_TRICW|nr:HDOD domain-containing protein [Trinickia caryophylli]PMS14180.1 HDOD domain-containing protein [Trinickia caryophylli]TRX17878.1 HDOD domain-containing protein [Trinickia caryophylli]WQE11352.1 HDOD domain-containing protein [Trinickia caryophylli]SMF23507.1 HDOD domain-containing protein [Trinickia caryophylli]GLU32509.1 HDOD domain-containing protein [Trinickia caryophylli]